MPDFNFKKYLNPQALAGALNKMPPLHTPIMDLIYPESAQVNHPFDTIGYEDLASTIKNIPLVTRGGQSYALSLDDNKLKWIDPANLNPSHFVKAADLNRLRNLPDQAVQAYINKKIDKLRRAIRKSKEAMAAQSLGGKISYDLSTRNGGIVKYEVNFGSVQTHTISTKWDAQGATPGKMVADLGKMMGKISAKSDAARFIALVDFDTFGVMTDLCGQAKSTLPIVVSTDKIKIGSLEIYPVAGTYLDYSTGNTVPVVAAKKIKVIGLDDNFQFFNCALDSLDANFAGIPFGIREVKKDDPEGIDLIAMARPMPVPNVDAICDATVLT